MSQQCNDMGTTTIGNQYSDGAAFIGTSGDAGLSHSTSLEEGGSDKAQGTVITQLDVKTRSTSVDRDTKMQMGPDVPQSIRNGFIKKVYALLTIMLIITSLVAIPFQFLSHEMINQNRGLLAGLMWGSLILTFAMACFCSGAMRKFPSNYVFLFVFSVCYGFICGCVSMSYTLPSVMLAAGMTAGIFCLLTAYACLTKTDFTGLGPYLIAALFGLIVFGLFIMIFSWMWPGVYSMLHTLYAAVGAILFSFYIVYDTQLVVGGRHKRAEFSVDDYAFAALNLYLDIINLFLMLLTFCGSRK